MEKFLVVDHKSQMRAASMKEINPQLDTYAIDSSGNVFVVRGREGPVSITDPGEGPIPSVNFYIFKETWEETKDFCPRVPYEILQTKLIMFEPYVRVSQSLQEAREAVEKKNQRVKDLEESLAEERRKLAEERLKRATLNKWFIVLVVLFLLILLVLLFGPIVLHGQDLAF